jgi:GT2 family glycosyltransferase
MEISIIIVTFNSSPFIEGCLRSILKQLMGIDYELIIVDNASEDETCKLIERTFPQIHLIRNDSNEGFAKANNVALQKAMGHFILLINPDTVWERGELKEAIGFMKDHPEVGALGCRLIFEDGSWQKSYGNFPTLKRELEETFYLPGLFPRSKWFKGIHAYEEGLDPKPVDWISCTFFLCHRKLMAEVGFLDERYFMYYEDIDLSRKMREKGKEIYYYPRIEVIHHQKNPSIIDFGESPYIYFSKFFGPSFAPTLRYILVFKSLLRMAVFASLAFFSERAIYREKFRTNYGTFKFHFFKASKIIRDLKITSGK